MAKSTTRKLPKREEPLELKYLAPGSSGLATSEFEISMIVFWHTFSRWVERCGLAAGIDGLSTFDLLILHFLRLRRRPLRAIDLGFALSIEDLHLVSYSLRKLSRLELVSSEKRGKEILYTTTAKSEKSFQRYVEVRQRLLISAVDMIHNPGYDMNALAGMMRALSGIYEQAARAAASEFHAVIPSKPTSTAEDQSDR